MLSLLLVAAAHAHGTAYALTAISASGEHLWGTTDAWGLVHSADGGETWQWYCEESLQPADSTHTLQQVYDLEALPDGRALLAGRDGLLVLDPDACGLTRVAGLPPTTAGAYPVASFGGAYLVAVYSDDGDGVMRCSLESCAPTDLWADDQWVKSILPAGDAVWATTTNPAYAGGLWRSADGSTWTRVASWPEGSPDLRVMSVRGDRILLWAQGRADVPENQLLRSTDGGASWTEVLSFGAWTDAVPTLLSFGGSGLLRIGSPTLHVYESRDDGATWTDTNTLHPESKTLLCVSDDGLWAGADHFADGFDVGRVVGVDVEAVACLDDAEPAACFAGSCDDAYGDFVERGAYGGGQCQQDLTPAPAEEGGCGGGGAESAVVLGGLAWLARRYRPGTR